MLIIPAIDIKEGQCVRLKQGLMEEVTVYSNAPATMARKWISQGARRLHLVDLDGAVQGRPVNGSAIRDIVSEVDGKVPVQLGGGVRDLKTIQEYLDIGISNVVLGTAAVKNLRFVEEACSTFQGQIMLGIDAKNGRVAIDGWATETSRDAGELAKRYEGMGVEAIIYTDISRDGMGSGINAAATGSLAKATNIPIIASGGLKNLDDVRTLSVHEQDGVCGVIAGRALYEGSLGLLDAQKLSDELSGGI